MTEELGFDLPPPPRPSKSRVVLVVVIGVMVLGGAFAFAWIPKLRAQRELTESSRASESAVQRVQIVQPKAKSSDRALVLPGSVQALEETVVYSRARGYIRTWDVDIGDRVKAGDVLANVDTPELDQQLAQARAELAKARAGLAQAMATREYSAMNLNRYKQLTPQGITSQMELEQKQAQSSVDQANVTVAQAAIAAQEANVGRLVQEKSFAHVVAPFGGTVNERMIARGALVSPTTPLFRISAMDPVRVFVQVPQDTAPSVRADVPAHVTVREYGGRVFEGTVARAAGSLDAASRTMNTEVRVPNPNNELLAGMYAQVSLTLPSPHRVLEVPATAVMNDARGIRVALVDPDNKVRFVTVVIERDTGPTIEIASGIQESDRIIKLVSADLTDGTKVDIAP